MTTNPSRSASQKRLRREPEHPVISEARRIDTTHPGLGRTCIAATVAAMAGRLVMIVAPPGTGKSATTNAILSAIKPSIWIDQITRAGMSKYAEELTGFAGVIVVDDLGGIETPYLRQATVTAFSELVYSHQMNKATGFFNFTITNFHGGAVMNVQPIIVRHLVRSEQWDSNIGDKVLRYYHLVRPIRPAGEPPEINLELTIPWRKVQWDGEETPSWLDWLRTGTIQWSRSRVAEHCLALAKTCASLARRTRVAEADIDAARWLFRPMRIERYAIQRSGFETGRKLDDQILHVLGQLATYGRITLDSLLLDYKLPQSSAYAIMGAHKRLLDQRAKSPAIWAPSELAREILSDIGYDPPEVSYGH